jgi:hypothetical protein
VRGVKGGGWGRQSHGLRRFAGWKPAVHEGALWPAGFQPAFFERIC